MPRRKAIITLTVIALVWLVMILRAPVQAYGVRNDALESDPSQPWVIEHRLNGPLTVHVIPTQCGPVYAVVQLEAI